MSDKKFIEGLIVKAPNDNAPEYVKAKLSIKRQELIDWLSQQHGDWINADIKVSQGGKYYAQVDDWKPDSQRGGSSGSRGGAPQRERQQTSKPTPVDDFDSEDIPFISDRHDW